MIIPCRSLSSSSSITVGFEKFCSNDIPPNRKSTIRILNNGYQIQRLIPFSVDLPFDQYSFDQTDFSAERCAPGGNDIIRTPSARNRPIRSNVMTLISIWAFPPQFRLPRLIDRCRLIDLCRVGVRNVKHTRHPSSGGDSAALDR